ncbi:hypothetical protein CTEN210_08802 [Chaetoceros tenuissimus]|uniref:HIT-type domain-containing protein n=1 Tax=Chaetoceros tenuissimus TaxID=426638 RepID=A0AAD3CW83_9STRA|nr:hypothetical protein CTEN210_08802 [Chaetoceros tenuissimus]
MSRPPINLPKVNPKWKRSFKSTDILPTSVAQISNDLLMEADQIICPVCNKNEARYTCPKCSVPYCSIDCYKIHDLLSNDGERSGGGRCTESFYREKVKEVTDLHVKDEKNTSQMRDALTRTFYNEGGLVSENNEEESIDPNEKITLTDEELMELASCGLTLEDTDEDVINDNSDQILQMLPTHIREKFEEAVKRGEVSDLVNEWQPFWIRENGKLEFDSMLEDRIISIPVIPVKASVKDVLRNNICELVYMAAWTLRLFSNATVEIFDERRNEEVATFFMHHSKVLSNDEKYEGLEHVLVRCTSESSNFTSNRSKSSIDWKLLVNDCIHICKHRRMILKLLFEMIDIIDNGRKRLKHKEDKESKYLRKQLFLSKKKIEYYLSFCQSHWDAVAFDVVNCIQEWMVQWALEDKEDILTNTLLSKIQGISSSSESLQKTNGIKLHNQEPLIVPIETTKKSNV